MWIKYRNPRLRENHGDALTIHLDLGKHSPAVRRLGKERQLKRPPLGSSAAQLRVPAQMVSTRQFGVGASSVTCQPSPIIPGPGKSTEGREWAIALL